MQTEKQARPHSITVVEQGESITFYHSGVGELYTEAPVKPLSDMLRIYCKPCKQVVARTEIRGVCFYDVATMLPHKLPPNILLPGLIDLRTALGLCVESCPNKDEHEIAHAHLQQ
ncbi:hypothetical protein ccbrp13_55890 [Ktedonobacteria bacterium brp13]|nr:hypothetical protein ccbrp13_55890 [Ktedonobacteria bacterium brp13]